MITTPSIYGQRATFVCNLAGQLKSPKEISTLIMDKFGRAIGVVAITTFVEKNKDWVGKIREQYLSDISTIPIAQEKIRLERDENLYQLSQTIAKPTDRISSGLACLKEAREELKGGHIQYNQYNQYNQFTDAELLEKQKKIEGQIIEISKTNVKEVVNVA